MAVSTRPLGLEGIGATRLHQLGRAMTRASRRADIPSEQSVDARYSRRRAWSSGSAAADRGGHR